MLKYRSKALLVALAHFASGIGILDYAFLQSLSSSSQIPSVLLAFVGLGLLTIGSLILFAAPEEMVTASTANAALATPVADLALVIRGMGLGESIIHFPTPTLAAQSNVVLVLLSEKNLRERTKGNPPFSESIAWEESRKVLYPPGIGLMKRYETLLNRDFLAAETDELSRLLYRAIVVELQMATDFSLRETRPGLVEALWEKPIVQHACQSNEVSVLPALCSLCSSVACALAEASGKPVRVQKAISTNEGSYVTTTYAVLADEK